jgi:hypothetical protein
MALLVHPQRLTEWVGAYRWATAINAAVESASLEPNIAIDLPKSMTRDGNRSCASGLQLTVK